MTNPADNSEVHTCHRNTRVTAVSFALYDYPRYWFIAAERFSWRG